MSLWYRLSRNVRAASRLGGLIGIALALLALITLPARLEAQVVKLTAQAGTDKPLTPGHFSTVCGTGEVLAGVYGKAKTYIDRIGGYCVKVTTSGAWDGELRATESFGGPGGITFDSKCNRGEAMSGFKGRHGLYVDRIEVRCTRLTSRTSVAGTVHYVSPAVGGSGGSAFGPYICPNLKPAAGFGGQAVLLVDALFFMCRP